jgi:transposase
MNHLETEVHKSLVTERVCPCGCGAPAKTIGFDESWRLEWIPGRLVRHHNLVEKVVFPDHAEGTGTVVTAEPARTYALARAMCGDRLLAQLIADKYLDHLPLYRLEQRFGRGDVALARSTMCTWLMNAADLLRQIWKRLVLEVRQGVWLRADAASMPVMDRERRKGQVHLGHMWAYGNYETVVFKYTADKKATTVADMLEGFAGVLLVDGASDFNLVCSSDDVVRAGCWAHARRKLYEALSSEPTLAMKGLKSIRQLFVAERTVMVAPIEDRVALRAELCEPVLAGIRAWVDEELAKTVPRSPMHAALRYIDNQWDRLRVFLQQAEIACHNNDSERDLRRPVKGKRNYLFAGSPRGAEAAAIYYSLLGTCLLQGIDPLRYLREIFGRLDEPPSALTPHAVRERWEAELPP